MICRDLDSTPQILCVTVVFVRIRKLDFVALVYSYFQVNVLLHSFVIVVVSHLCTNYRVIYTL